MILGVFGLSLGTSPQPALPADLPCDNWPLHTRTRPEICPEVIWTGPPTRGLPALWALAFDANNTLYFTRPALGEVWSMGYLPDGRFGPAVRYEVAFGSLDELAWLTGLRHSDKPLSRPFALDPAGATLWYADGPSHLRSTMGGLITLADGANPASLVFYQGAAFPALRGALLFVTGGSWNGRTIEGYELAAVPFSPAGHPGNPFTLIPANVGERNSSDASLTELTFFPDHPVALAVDRNGWIYIGLREGMIVRLRPRPAS
jgi:hypothetical protein